MAKLFKTTKQTFAFVVSVDAARIDELLLVAEQIGVEIVGPVKPRPNGWNTFKVTPRKPAVAAQRNEFRREMLDRRWGNWCEVVFGMTNRGHASIGICSGSL